MILSDIAIRRPVFTTMVIAAVAIFGLVCLSRLGTDLFPRVEFPIITVISRLPGADPETVETTVSDPIEEAVSTVSGIKSLRSVSADSVSQVIIEFELSKDVDVAFQEISAKVAGAKGELPDDLDAPLIEKFDVDSAPIMALVVSGDKPVAELTRIADKTIKARLQAVRNVGQVKLVGGRERTMWVWLDRARLEGHGLAANEVMAALRSESVEIPGGRVESARRELVVKTRAECRTAEEFGALVVAWRGGSPVRLREVAARIEDGVEEERSLSRLDGRAAVSLLVRRQSGTNTLDVAKAVDREVARLQADLAPQGIVLVKAKEQGPYIERSIHEIWFHLVVGGALAVAIVFVFLRDWRTTLISALAIPVSVVGAFTLIYALGFTLNMLTMLALSLSIGILIDDAIVVIENIHRHWEDGMEPRKAAAFGTAEIGLAAFAITLSIVAVFVPVAFMDGMVGRFFYQFGLSVAGAVLLSLFVAFTLTPMLTARMLRHGGMEESGWARALEAPFKALEAGYRRLLAGALRWRWLTVLVAVAAFAGAILLGGQLRGEFKPDEDASEFTVRVKGPLGSPLPATDALFAGIRERLHGQPWIESTFTTIGADELQRVNEGEMYVKMKPKAARSLSQAEAMRWTRERLAGIAGAVISVEIVPRVSGGGMKASEMQMDLRGKDLAALGEAAQRVVASMAGAGGYVDTDTSWQTGKPELHVRLRRDACADLGVGAREVAATISTLIGGEEAVKFKDGGDRYDVRVRLADGQRNRLQDILDLSVRSRRGQLVPLRNLVEIEEWKGPLQIDRYNRSRQVTISTNLNKVAKGPGDRTLVLGEAKEEMKRFAAASSLPAGTQVAVIGMAEIMEESFRNLLFALGLAVVMVYMVLASQFESFLHPFTIMLSLPLSLVGALGLLVATGQTLSIFTMIGIIMLMGLVTKNAILLVDYTNTLRTRDSLDRTEALLRAGPVRLRPILMTTLAMIAGMLPLALGRGDGSETRVPMAVTVIGGLVTSTLLTLVVVPVVYSLVDDLRGRFARKGAGDTPR